MNQTEYSPTRVATRKPLQTDPSKTIKLKAMSKKIIISRNYANRMMSVIRRNGLEVQLGFSEVKRTSQTLALSPDSVFILLCDTLVMIVNFIHLNYIIVW